MTNSSTSLPASSSRGPTRRGRRLPRRARPAGRSWSSRAVRRPSPSTARRSASSAPAKLSARWPSSTRPRAARPSRRTPRCTGTSCRSGASARSSRATPRWRGRCWRRWRSASAWPSPAPKAFASPTLSCGHVPEHPHAVQLRACRHRRRGSRRGAPVRPQDQRLHEAFAGQRGSLRLRRRRDRGGDAAAGGRPGDRGVAERPRGRSGAPAGPRGRAVRGRLGRLSLGPTAAVAGDGLGELEQRPEPAISWARHVVDPDLVRVGVNADVRRVLLAEHQEAYRPGAAILVAVRAALAAWKGEDLAFAGVLPALRRPDCDRPREDDEQLLALEVVMEVHPLSGSQLVDGEAEMLRSRGLAEPGATVVRLLREFGRGDVRHGLLGLAVLAARRVVGLLPADVDEHRADLAHGQGDFEADLADRLGLARRRVTLPQRVKQTFEPLDLCEVLLLGAAIRHRVRPWPGARLRPQAHPPARARQRLTALRRGRARGAHRPPFRTAPPASAAVSGFAFPPPPARGCALPLSAAASQCSSPAAAASSSQPGPAWGNVFDEGHVLGLPLTVSLGDLESDGQVGAPALRPGPPGEALAEHREPFALVGEDESEVLDLVEPEHLALHWAPFRRRESSVRRCFRRTRQLRYAFS